MKNRKPIEEMGFWKFIVAIEEYILVITSFVAACIVQSAYLRDMSLE